MAIFPGQPGLAGFIEAKDDVSGGNSLNRKTCKAPVKLSPPTPNFLQAVCPLLLNRECQSTEGKAKIVILWYRLWYVHGLACKPCLLGKYNLMRNLNSALKLLLGWPHL